MILLAMLMMVFPFLASANETINSDTNINKTLLYFSKLIGSEVEVSEPIEIEVPKTEEEVKRDAILGKWKTKQALKWENLPKESFTINASAYTAAADECDKSDGVTASGLVVKANRTIACPPEFPFGVKIQIADMGIFVCEDRGGAIKANKIDIYMETKDEAFKFGRQNLIAQVVE